MAITQIHWSWEEAFDKFGFDDGDGPNFTTVVADFLHSLGYEVRCDWWGIHNYMIMELALGGRDLLADIEVGYDDPREYLPAELIAALDERFASLVTIERGLINHAQRPAED